MCKVVYTSNTPFDMRDWERRRDIISVSAGRNCAMAILNDGAVLIKTCLDSDDVGSAQRRHIGVQSRFLFIDEQSREIMNQPSLTLTYGWEHIKQVEVSRYVGLVAAGLREDGTCIAWSYPEKRADCGRAVIANTRIREWQGIVEIAVSDAIFALDRSGYVHHLSFYGPDDYYEVNYWEQVSRIVSTTQNSVFGITKEGKVLCAGGNCRDSLREPLHQKTNVKDICTTGSECEKVIFLHDDGTISSTAPWLLKNTEGRRFVRLFGHFYYSVFAQTEENAIIPLVSSFTQSDVDKIIGWEGVQSFTMGQKNYSAPFAIAVTE